MFQNHAENETRRLVSDLFLSFKKALYKIKTSGLKFSFKMFLKSLTWYTVKTNCMKL